MLTHTEKENIVKEILTIYNRLSECSAKANLDRFLGYYHNSPQFTHISGDGQMRDFSEFREICSEYYNALNFQSIETVRQKIEVISDDTVIIAWKGKIKAELKNGDTLFMPDYCVTSVFRKTDRDWRIIHSHESTLPPELLKRRI